MKFKYVHKIANAKNRQIINKADLKAFSVEMLSRCTGSLFQADVLR